MSFSPLEETTKTAGYAEKPEEERSRNVTFSARTIALTLAGTMLVTFIATLDQTIVGTALPHIIADLQGFDQIAWVTTIYLLTSTVAIPIYGKLSDLFGRKRIFLIGLLVFLLGSVLSGISQSMFQLVIFRGIQGLGAGGLESIAVAIVGDLFPPRERGKWIGITSSSYALASIVGPLAGGLLTDAISWRWIFYINLPFGVLALLVLLFIMPALRAPDHRAVVDYIGALLIVLAIVPLLLGFTWAGSSFPWLSWQSLALFGSSLVFLTLLILYSIQQEQLGRDPILLPGMFKNVRVFSLSLLASMLIGIILLGSVYFLPTFLQSVIGVSATNSGLVTMPFALASIVGAILAGALVTITGRYKFLALTGILVLLAGVLLLLRLDVHTTALFLLLALVVLGIGVGSGLSIYTVVAQNALPEKLGQASSAVVFFRQLGQSIGLTAFGALVTSYYVPAFYRALPAGLDKTVPPQVLKVFEDPLVLLSPNIIDPIRTSFEHYGAQGQDAFMALLQAVKLGLAESIHAAVLLSLLLVIITFITVCFLKEIPLRGKSQKKEL